MINRGVKIFEEKILWCPKRALRILVIKLDHMGDLLVAVPALIRLREKFKGAEIDLVCGEWNVPLARKLGIFAKIYTFNYFRHSSAEQPEARAEEERSLIGSLTSYDMAIDLRRHPDTRFLLSKVSATVRAGFKSFLDHDKLLDICVEFEPDAPGLLTQTNKTHAALQMLSLIEAIPVETVELPQIEAPSGGKSKSIGIFPGAGSAVKQWPIKNFSELVMQLRSAAPDLEIHVYLSERERSLQTFFNNSSNASVYTGLVLDQLIHCVAKNAVVIANNSFGAHLSSYLGARVVAIYGGHDTAQEWHPIFGEFSVIYSDVSCSPCHLLDVESCAYGMVCLEQIPVETVRATALRYLEQPSNDSNGRPGLCYLSGR